MNAIENKLAEIGRDFPAFARQCAITVANYAARDMREAIPDSSPPLKFAPFHPLTIALRQRWQGRGLYYGGKLSREGVLGYTKTANGALAGFKGEYGWSTSVKFQSRARRPFTKDERRSLYRRVGRQAAKEHGITPAMFHTYDHPGRDIIRTFATDPGRNRIDADRAAGRLRGLIEKAARKSRAQA